MTERHGVATLLRIAIFVISSVSFRYTHP
jgi:hypothetical protein